MAKSTDWLLAACMLILAMCRNGLAYMAAVLRTLWDVPEDEFMALGTLFFLRLRRFCRSTPSSAYKQTREVFRESSRWLRESPRR
jgi:hypothetical protein